MTTDPRKAKFRENILRKNCAPKILALISLYYPPLLREKILRCCRAQLAGNMRRTCRHRLCPACNSRESRTRAEAQYLRFAQCTPPGKPVRLAHEVYTLPPHLRHLIVTPEGFAAWRRATLATIREAHDGADVAGVMNLHPIGDTDFAVFHPHWDVVVNGYVLKDGRPRAHRPGRPDFKQIRAAYIRNLARELRLAPEWVPETAEIHIGVKGGRINHSQTKTRHIVRYSARDVYLPHRAWLDDHGTKGDWRYKPRERQRLVIVKEGKDAMTALLSHDAKLEGRKRHVWFGYMQNRLRKTAENAFQTADAGEEAS